MRNRGLFQIICACIFAVLSFSLIPTVAAVDGDCVVRLEDMNCELVDVAETVVLSNDAKRAITSINSDIPANKTAVSEDKLPLEIGDTVTINCSYSPASTSMDFGVIAPDGYFYYFNVKGGSINRSILVSQRGSYSVAIRNKSTHTVTVVGFVNY